MSAVKQRLLSGWVTLACVSVSAVEPPEGKPERNVNGIMDNSFLIEEAYNQEKGVIQHIATLQYGLNRRHAVDDQFWNFAFTQEWPVVTQTHQFSYTVPYAWAKEGGHWRNGLTDMLLNYRLQAYLDPDTLTALAPRASLVLPTGDAERGLGEDTAGLQLNVPFSTTLGDEWFAHFNAGLTYLPGAASAQDHDLVHFNLGGSLIYAATADVHFLLELAAYWNEYRQPGIARERQFVALLSPGVRKAFNFGGETQLVVGLAFPVGISPKAPELGGFFYLSFEHSRFGGE